MSDLYENDFQPCETCGSKPGSPLLCASCLHNRELIGRQSKVATELETIKILITGGIMPDGWSIGSGIPQLVHSAILEFRATIREQSAKIERFGMTIDTLIEREGKARL